MFRKSLLLLSLVSFAALIAWGFVPGGATPTSASPTTSNQDCRPSFTINAAELIGTRANPTGVSVTWSNVQAPPCYRITGFKVTFVIARQNANPLQFEQTVGPNATSANVLPALWNDSITGGTLPPEQRPNSISATVVAEAVPVSNQARRSETSVRDIN